MLELMHQTRWLVGARRVFSGHASTKRLDAALSAKRDSLLKRRDIVLHLRKSLEEPRLHGPILEVVRVFEEHR